MIYYTYFKEFAIKYKEHAAIGFLVDKNNVPAGEPNHAVSTNVRPHNISLTSSSVTLEALSHNWKMIGLIPSVVLMSENPNVSKVLFLSGRPFFTTKDKVFAPF